MTKNKVMENSCGLMVDVTGVNGTMVNKMVKEPISQVLAKKSMVNGNKERESDGLAEVNNKMNENTS